MRVEGTYGPGPGSLPENKGPATSKTDAAPSVGPGGAALLPPETSDAAPAAQAELLAARPELVRAALAAAAVDPQAVAEARKLLQSGQLDTPEAWDRLAQALANRGI